MIREVVEELGIEALRGAFVGSYPFERLNQIIFVYHVLGGAGPIRLAADELAAYQEIPIEKVRPWPQGTGRSCQLARDSRVPPHDGGFRNAAGRVAGRGVRDGLLVSLSCCLCP